jgi:hypothetical protein
MAWLLEQENMLYGFWSKRTCSTASGAREHVLRLLEQENMFYGF